MSITRTVARDCELIKKYLVSQMLHFDVVLFLSSLFNEESYKKT
jgi:hypothetical protein